VIVSFYALVMDVNIIYIEELALCDLVLFAL